MRNVYNMCITCFPVPVREVVVSAAHVVEGPGTVKLEHVSKVAGGSVVQRAVHRPARPPAATGACKRIYYTRYT